MLDMVTSHENLSIVGLFQNREITNKAVDHVLFNLL